MIADWIEFAWDKGNLAASSHRHETVFLARPLFFFKAQYLE